MERRFNESLRYFGVETMVPSEDDWATEDGESLSEEDLSSSEASPLRGPSNLDGSDIKEGLSKNAVATWFQLSYN